MVLLVALLLPLLFALGAAAPPPRGSQVTIIQAPDLATDATGETVHEQAPGSGLMAAPLQGSLTLPEPARSRLWPNDAQRISSDGFLSCPLPPPRRA